MSSCRRRPCHSNTKAPTSSAALRQHLRHWTQVRPRPHPRQRTAGLRRLPSRSRRDPARRGPLRPWPQRAANLPADPIREQHASPVRVATITTQPVAVRPNWSNPGAVDTGPASDRKCRMGWRALSHLARPAPLATRARVSPMRPCHWQQVAGGGRTDVPEIGALRAEIHARAGNQRRDDSCITPVYPEAAIWRRRAG